MLIGCIVMLFFAYAHCENVGSRSCPGGYSHGTRFESGRYWYECNDGKVIPKGCLSDDQRRVDISGTYDTDTNRMQCVLGPDGYLTIIYSSCVKDGRQHDVNEQWDDGDSYYICKKMGPNNLQVRPAGCIAQGLRVDLGEKQAQGDFLYQCKVNSLGRARLNIVGCVKEGRKYMIGEAYESGHHWFTCTVTGSKVTGCMHESQRLQDGDRYFRDDVIYECSVSGAMTEAVPYGCLQRDGGSTIERRLGCFWIEGSAPYMYEMTCKYDKASNTAVKAATRCNYKEARGVFDIDPGCYRVVDSTAIGCWRKGVELHIKTYPADQIQQLSGLSPC